MIDILTQDDASALRGGKFGQGAATSIDQLGPEIVHDGQDGFLVPRGDAAALAGALRNALDRPWDRPAIVRRARRFDWAESVEQALDELNAALKRPA